MPPAVAMHLRAACWWLRGAEQHNTLHRRYDDYAFERIAESAFGRSAVAANFQQVTFLRMGDLMFDHWPAFCLFLRRMQTTE